MRFSLLIFWIYQYFTWCFATPSTALLSHGFHSNRLLEKIIRIWTKKENMNLANEFRRSFKNRISFVFSIELKSIRPRRLSALAVNDFEGCSTKHDKSDGENFQRGLSSVSDYGLSPLTCLLLYQFCDRQDSALCIHADVNNSPPLVDCVTRINHWEAGWIEIIVHRKEHSETHFYSLKRYPRMLLNVRWRHLRWTTNESIYIYQAATWQETNHNSNYRKLNINRQKKNCPIE